MNYKQMLDKIEELERRIEALEQGQRKQNTFPGAPTFTPNWVDNMPRIEVNPSWPLPPYTVTCKGTLQ